MKVLIIERMIDLPFYIDRAKILEEKLLNRGFSVDLRERLRHQNDLMKYNVVVAHPSFQDSIRIAREIEKRPDFRAVLCTPDQKLYIDIESDQLCSYYPAGEGDYDGLVSMLQNGWS